MVFSPEQIFAFAIAIIGLALTIANLIDKLVIFKKRANEPHEALEKRVTYLEEKQKETDFSLKQGNDRFRAQDNTNEVLVRSTFALLEFEMQYCLTESKPVTPDLERAKNELHDYLYKKM